MTDTSSPTDDTRLEELSAQVLSRSAFLTTEQITGFRLSIARMEGKLDAALAVGEEVEEHREAINKLGLQVARLEAHMGVLIWVAGVAGMILAGAVGTIFAFILNRGAP